MLALQPAIRANPSPSIYRTRSLGETVRPTLVESVRPAGRSRRLWPAAAFAACSTFRSQYHLVGRLERLIVPQRVRRPIRAMAQSAQIAFGWFRRYRGLMKHPSATSTAYHRSSGEWCRCMSATPVAAQCRGPAGRARDRHLTRNRPALVEPNRSDVRRGDPTQAR